MSLHPINILERYWKFTAFRGQQEAAIEAVLSGEDTFVLMPTGGGKSICYQVPALIKKGICIVVSPLIALMQDQVEQLNAKGIKALAITSGISAHRLDTILDNCIYGNYKFLYVSPERLQQELVQNRIQQMDVSIIAVDEAHCISQWGNDFRPAYATLSKLRELRPTASVIALTATAKPKVVEDIIENLDFINPKVFKQSFKRDNLGYMALHEEDKYYRLETILKKYKQSSVVYVRNRRSTTQVAALLNSKGIGATFYHGGLNATDKKANMAAWMQNKKQVIVATNAFGMGIDKPDVKTVIHLNLPESIESYFQEAGRAGRNGQKAFAIILKNKNDEVLVKNQFLNVLPSTKLVKHVFRKLCSYFQIPYGEGTFTTHDFDFNHFCKTYKLNSILCYNALLVLDRNSILTLSKQFKNKVSLQCIVSNKTIFGYIAQHPENALILKTILRSYGGIFDNDTPINTLKIADKAAVTEQHLLEALKRFDKDEIVTLNCTKTDAQITFVTPREDDKTINRIAPIIQQQNTIKTAQVNAVLNYVNNDATCKTIQLLDYFGEKTTVACGNCSVCISQHRKKKPPVPVDNLKSKIITLLESGAKSSRTIADTLHCENTQLHTVLKHLLEQKIITITQTNTYKLSHL